MKQISCAFIIFRYVWILVNCGMFLMCEGRGQTTPVCWVCWQSCPRSDPVEAVCEECSVIHTHTHIHLFNGPFSGTTRVSQYQKGKINLDFTEARDSEWQWHQLGRMQVCTSLQTDNHASTPPLSFLQALCPSCRPANSIKALKALVSK